MRKVVPALIAILIIIFFLFFSGLIPSLFKKTEFKRVSFPTPSRSKNVVREFEFKDNQFKYEIISPFIHITRNEIQTTFNGVLLLGEQKGRENKALQILRPELSGNYMMQFFLYMERSPTDKARVQIEHVSGHSIVQTIEIKKVNPRFQYQFPLQLKKNDQLNFIVEGRGIAAISHPVFFRVKENQTATPIFIICVDTLRYDRIGAYNPDKTCTPNIDQLTKDSLNFTQAYSTSGWTLPALASFFTGLSPFQHQVDYGNEVLKETSPALFDLLKARFICYSLTGSAFASARFGFARGFDYYTERHNDGWARNSAKRLFTEAIKILQYEKYENIAFFLHTYQVHDPYFPEKKLAKEFYQGIPTPLQFNIVKFLSGRKELAKDVPDEKQEQIERIYDAGVYTFDYRFGEFIDYLKSQNLYDRATIILFSDHGEEFKDHSCWIHTHTLYNELIRIPLIVKLPQNEMAGQIVSTPVSIMDILPTVLELCSIEPDSSLIEGRSLLQATQNKSNKRVLAASLAPYLMHIPGKLAVIVGQDKLIYSEEMTEEDLSFFVYPPPYEQYELYNIIQDPHEKNNVFGIDLQKSRDMLKLLKTYKIKRGKAGFLPELEEQLKALGYIK